jgi:hypothetical protein
VLVFVWLIFALSLSADTRTGQVQGRAVDKAGKPLAGVRVTLIHAQAAAQTIVTGASGLFRFPAVFPGPDYSVKAEHPDYKTTVRSNVVVTMGGRVAFDVPLELGKPEETVNVKTPLPAIDPTRFTSGAAFGGTELQTLPTARNPWAVIQLVPAVMLDREDVGGSESIGQSHFVTRGDDTNGSDNTWMIDGVGVGDPVDLGLSAIRYDFDTIDALTVITGGAADVTQQTSGVAVNILTRRGGNKLSGAAHFYLTDHAFQSSNMTSTLQSQGVNDTNRIQQITDFGASAGGPIAKNRLWLWGAYGVQDLFNYTIYNTPDRAQFNDYSFKLNAEIFKGNRAEALFMTSADERFGVNADVSKPEGDHQTGRFVLGSPVFKLQDEQVVGPSFYLSAKFTWVNAGTILRPTVDEAMTNPVAFDIAEDLYVPYSTSFGRSWDYSQDIRRQKGLEVTATLFEDSVLGLSHEIKGGLAFAHKKVTRTSGFPQNYEVFRDFTAPLIDFGEGLAVPPSDWQRFVLNREDRRIDLLDQSSGFLQDTIVKGRFALQLGLRYDGQRPTTGAYGVSTILSTWSNVFSSNAMTNLSNYFPPLSVNAVDSKYRWSTWSPRVALSWDLKGDGRTVLKLALAQYGDLLTPGANVTAPLGLTGNFNFWWNDANSDSLVDLTEMYWIYAATNATAPNQLYALFDSSGNLTDAASAALVGGFEGDAYLAGNYSGFDWSDREAVNYDHVTTFFRSDVNADAKNVKTSPRTREISLSLEKEIRPDLAASIAATYRVYDNFDWAKLYYPADIYPSTPDLVIDDTTGPWYAVAGTVPQTITYTDSSDKEVTIDLGEAGGRSWYLPISTFPGPTPYRMVDKSRATRTYMGLDLGVTKRLSDHWFLNASVTLQDQRYRLRGSTLDPTNVWAVDGQAYGNYGGSSDGKIPVQMFSRWLAKVSALYQLPWGLDLSATLQAREGWAIPHYITLAYANAESWPGLYRSNLVYLQPPAKDHLPAFSDLAFRIEKSFALGSGRMVLMADVFNVFNSAVVNRAYDAYYGTYYVDTDTFVPNPYNRAFNEILNPRVFRLGLRFEF